MKDINGITLNSGDYVKVMGRQINSFNIENIAIVDSIKQFSATILFNNNGMPMPFDSNPTTLMKLQPKDISNDYKSILSSARLLFDNMSLEMMSA